MSQRGERRTKQISKEEDYRNKQVKRRKIQHNYGRVIEVEAILLQMEQYERNIMCFQGKVEKYSSRNLLTLHSDKCKVLILSKTKFVGPLPELKIQGKSLRVVKK